MPTPFSGAKIEVHKRGLCWENFLRRPILY